MQLIESLASHDVAGENEITWWKTHFISFWSFWLINGIVPLMTLLTSCDTDTSLSSIKWPKVTVHIFFSYLDLMNTVALLTIPLASHDADTSANGVKWPKKSFCILFWNKKCNRAIADTISVLWCQYWHHIAKKSLFQLSSSNEQSGAIGDAVSITWQQCWY